MSDPAAFLLLGAAPLIDWAPASAGIHAWTGGAIGVITLAVMSRANLGHTGRPLVASHLTQAIYVVLLAAAIARVCAALHAEWGRHPSCQWLALFGHRLYRLWPPLRATLTESSIGGERVSRA